MRMIRKRLGEGYYVLLPANGEEESLGKLDVREELGRLYKILESFRQLTPVYDIESKELKILEPSKATQRSY